MALTSRVVAPRLDISVEADVEEARRAFSKISPKGINRAASNALNVMGRTVRKESLAAMRKRRYGQGRSLTKSVFIRRSSAARLTVEIASEGRPVSLKAYGAKQTKAGITVKIGDRRKNINVPGAFFSSGKEIEGASAAENNRRTLGGHVFERRGRKRGQLRKLMGPSYPTAFAHKIVQAVQRRAMARDWARVFAEKIDDQLIKAGFKR